MRVMKMICPECLAIAMIRKTNRKHPQLADVYCSCTNVECGHTFVMTVAFSHTLSPSALKGLGRVKELIDAMPEQDREKALEFLLSARNRA